MARTSSMMGIEVVPTFVTVGIACVSTYFLIPWSFEVPTLFEGTRTVEVRWIVIGWFALSGIMALQRRARWVALKKARDELDEVFRDAPVAASPAPPAPSSEVLESLGDLSQRILEERRALHLVNESAFIQHALHEALEHAPPLPRNAKRAANRLRLLAIAAHGRGLLQGEGRITARQLGKWVGLQERWPELALGVARRPVLLKEIEETDGERRRALVAPYVTDADSMEDLERFLTDRPRLAPVAQALAHFEGGQERGAQQAAPPGQARTLVTQ